MPDFFVVSYVYHFWNKDFICQTSISLYVLTCIFYASAFKHNIYCRTDETEQHPMIFIPLLVFGVIYFYFIYIAFGIYIVISKPQQVSRCCRNKLRRYAYCKVMIKQWTGKYILGNNFATHWRSLHRDSESLVLKIIYVYLLNICYVKI